MDSILEKIKLKNIVDINSNLATAKNQKIKVPKEVNELKIGMLKSRTEIEIPKETVIQEAHKIINVKKEDIILKRVSTIFATYVTEEIDMVLGSNLILIRLKDQYKDKIYAPYLSAYIDSKIKVFVRTGVTMPMLMLSDLQNLEIPVIDYDMQKIIGDAWVENDKLHTDSILLANERFDYNLNLINKYLEE